ncbi:DUF177 domain-containing protein [soil metagenome]
MTAREFDPRSLDVTAFARDGSTLEGDWPLAEFGRIAEAAPAESLPTDDDAVQWSAHGERRPVRGGESEIRLHLTAHGDVALVCQRCLKPVLVTLDVARNYLFVHGEETAAEIDVDSEDDVLAITRALDLHELIEDELLLAMPLVPRHEVCPEPLPVPIDEEEDDGAPNPFASLAALKRGPPN